MTLARGEAAGALQQGDSTLHLPSLVWWSLVILWSALIVHVILYVGNGSQTVGSSRSFLVLAVGMVIAALAVIGFSLAILTSFQRQRVESVVEHLGARLDAWRDPLLLVLILICLGVGLGMRPEWLYAHFGIAAALTAAAGYWILFGGLKIHWDRRIWLLLAATAVAAIMMIRGLGLVAFPYINITDEPWVLNWALGVLRDGHATDSIMMFGNGDIQQFMILPGLWLRIFGVSFWEARLFFLLLTLPIIAMSALAARRLYDDATGAITAVLLFGGAVLVSGGRIRHDIALGLSTAAALWCFAEATYRDRDILHFAGGMVIGLGLFAHYHAAVLGAAFTLGLYLPRYLAGKRGRGWLPEAGAVWFVLGGICGVGVVFLIQIAPNLDGFLVKRQPRSPATLSGWLSAVRGYVSALATTSKFETLLIAAGVIAAFLRRHLIDVSLALTVIFCHLTLAVAAAEPWIHYIIPFAPLYALLVASLLTQLPKLKSAHVEKLALLTGVFLGVVGIGQTIEGPLSYIVSGGGRSLPEPAAAAWIRDHVDHDQTVLGQHYYYLFLLDYPFISPFSPETADTTLYPTHADVWDAIHPDYVIIDRNLADCCLPEPIYDPDYLDSRGYRIVAEISGDKQPVEIYASPAAHARNSETQS